MAGKFVLFCGEDLQEYIPIRGELPVDPSEVREIPWRSAEFRDESIDGNRRSGTSGGKETGVFKVPVFSGDPKETLEVYLTSKGKDRPRYQPYAGWLAEDGTSGGAAIEEWRAWLPAVQLAFGLRTGQLVQAVHWFKIEGEKK